MTRLRWARAIGVGAGLTAAAVLAAVVPLAWHAALEHVHARVLPRLAAPDQAYRIIASAIELSRFQGEPPEPPPPPSTSSSVPPSVRQPEVRKPIVLLTSSVAICNDDPAPSSGCPGVESDRLFHFPGQHEIPRQLRRELVAANRIRQPLPCLESEAIRCTGRKEIDDLFAGEGWWDDFHVRFPGAAGFVETTVPVLSEDERFALVYLSFSCGGVCGHGRLLLMERIGGSWRIAREESLWRS